MHLQVQLRVPLPFHLLLNHLVHTYAMTIAWNSATHMQPEVYLLVQPQVQLFEHIYEDLEVNLWVQFQLHCQVHPKFYYQACLKRIFRYSVTLLCITRRSKKLSLTFICYWSELAFIYSLKSIFESMFKCFPCTLSFATPVMSGRVIFDFLV